MRFEAKTTEEALRDAAEQLGRPAEQLKYRTVRDEKSFWGGRVVEIEVEVEDGREPPTREPEPLAEIGEPEIATRPAMAEAEAPGPGRAEDLAREDRRASAREGGMDEEAFATVEATLTELLAAAGFLVEIRRQPGEEMLLDLSGDDVEPLLANKGEGLSGLEVLAAKIVSKKLGRPVYPRLDAENFRAHQRESLEGLALRSAEEVKRTRRPQLLPPLSPGERRLIHLALAQDPEVETESEGEGFLKRVAVRPRAS